MLLLDMLLDLIWGDGLLGKYNQFEEEWTYLLTLDLVGGSKFNVTGLADKKDTITEINSAVMIYLMIQV